MDHGLIRMVYETVELCPKFLDECSKLFVFRFLFDFRWSQRCGDLEFVLE